MNLPQRIRDGERKHVEVCIPPVELDRFCDRGGRGVLSIPRGTMQGLNGVVWSALEVAL